MVIAQINTMAVMAIKVFDIIVIAVLILGQTAQRLKVPHDVPRHHTEDHKQHKGDHWGDYLASIRVRRNSSRVHMVTIAISIRIFKLYRSE
jgi:hypothetical protein